MTDIQKHIILLLFLLLVPLQLSGQTTPVDSLNNLLKTASSEQEKMSIYNQLGNAVRESDSAKTVHYTSLALVIAQQLDDANGQGNAYLHLAWMHAHFKQYSSSISFFEKSLPYFQEAKNQRGLADVYKGMAYLFRLKRDYKTSLNHYLKATELANSLGDEAYLATSYYMTAYAYVSVNDSAQTVNYFLKAKDIWQKLGNTQQEATIQTDLGLFYGKKGAYEKALEHYEFALHIFTKQQQKIQIAALNRRISTIYSGKGNYPLALDHLLKALRIYEALDKPMEISRIHNIIGILYDEQKDYNKALTHYHTALKTSQQIKEQRRTAVMYNNIGLVYQHLQQYDSAEFYYQKCIQMAEKQQLNSLLGWAYNGMGMVRQYQRNYQQAEDWISRAIEKRSRVRNKHLAQSYNSLGKNHLLQKQFKQALPYYLEASKICQETNHLVNYKDALESLSIIYEQLGQTTRAFDYYKQFKQLSDSLVNDETTKALTKQSLEYKFEQEKDQITLENERQSLQQQQLLKEQKYITYAFIGSFLAVLAIAFFIYKNYKEKNKANQRLAESNKEISQQREEILIINETLSKRQQELLQKKAQTELQYQMLETINRKMTDSINYASRIQKAMLGDAENMTAYFNNAFILFQPKDIVSGDFYWFSALDDHKKLLITADCTGHGVPGAFMTIMGAALLNEIVNANSQLMPHEILHQLDAKIIAAINHGHQNQKTKSKVNDGMDMQIILLDESVNKLYFSGAKNPLYRVRDQEITTFKGARFPIGSRQFKQAKVFETQEIDLLEGDQYYLSSDGYQDQFGGEHGRKYLKKRFRSLLLETSQLASAQQHDFLKKELYDWKDNYPQTDDILIVGFAI